MTSLMTPMPSRGPEGITGSLLFRREESAMNKEQQRRSPASPSYALTGYTRTPMSESRRRGPGRMTPGSGQGSPAPPARTLNDDMDLLPGMSETPELGAGSTFRWVEQAEATVDADNWVTVYGFQHCDAGVVLEEFRRCGEVVSYGCFGEEGGNFMHIQYADRLSAQRAVSMSGQQIRETLIVGVRPIDPAHKMRVASYMQRHEVPASPLDHGVYVKPELSRPMKPRASTNSAPLAMPNRTWWGKVTEFLLGL